MSENNESSPAIDLTRAPHGEMAAARLVAAAAALGDLAEDHYLELKGPPDLESKVAKAKVAKFILGASNRLPDRAAEAFEGYGVMIVGISKNGIEGVPPIERLALSQVIQPFLGAAGPRWDIVRVPLEGTINQVIVFVVDPPQQGQSPFICRANGEGLQNGRIYYRGDGETREATADELDLLMARGAARPSAPVELEVAIVGEVVPLVVDETALDELIGNVRRRLHAALPEAVREEPTVSGMGNGPADYLGGAMGISGTSRTWVDAATTGSRLAAFSSTEDPKTRSEEEYRAEIVAWEEQFRQSWAEAVELFAAQVLPAVEVVVVNTTRTFLQDVEVKIRFDGPILATERQGHGDRPAWRDLQLPPPPRKWGPRKRELGFGAGYADELVASLASPPAYMPGVYPSPDILWTASESVDAEIGVGDLRPEAKFQTSGSDLILLSEGRSHDRIKASWTATVRGYNEVFTGPVVLAIADPSYLTELIREFFHVGKA